MLAVMLFFAGSIAAGTYDLLWDYSTAPPTANPDRGLSYSSTVNDDEGVKNGLKGVKLNSSGWCSFVKAPVAGQLRLTFGPRSGKNPTSLQVFASENEDAGTYHLVGVTCEVDGLQTQTILLSAQENHVYITREKHQETVLERIEFVEGSFAEPAPCAPLESPVPLYSAGMRTDSMDANAAFFIRALMDANAGGEKMIRLPDGIYDLGPLALTAIEANDVTIIGESMEGTIIRNKPDYRYESIDKSATLRIAPGVEGTTLLNLTIENALDYYHDDNGRGVALWDQGTKTVCRNVRLLGHQDTYFSDNEGGTHYFEDCEIHGTVDFICGDGDVYFLPAVLQETQQERRRYGRDNRFRCRKGRQGFRLRGLHDKERVPRREPRKKLEELP